jgi:DNA-binding NtrC family response regulator
MACSLRDLPCASDRLIGVSPAMRRAREVLVRAGAAESPVLLLGETGTGKGVAARALHEASRRARGPFVHVDCAALSPTVFESELFGHERGAFTGAVTRRIGLLERARAGTLFLDEVGELTPTFQAKLLMALQDARFERVGGAAPVALDARVVAATNRDLSRDVARGRFRLDLYHRLRVLEIVLPPLRERPEDVAGLVRFHLPELATRAGVGVPRLSPGFLHALAARAWPGNVRELLHEVERALVLHPGEMLEAAALEPEPPLDWPCVGIGPADVARGGGDATAEIAAALASTGGNVSRAARRLGVARGTLRYRITRHGLGELIPRD